MPTRLVARVALTCRIGGERGYLTIDNIKDIYSVSKHPAVAAGKMTKEEALQEFLNGFEGSQGNRDGRITLDEWIKYYEEVSVSIDSDDYFGTMLAGKRQIAPFISHATCACARPIAAPLTRATSPLGAPGTWAHLKKKAADGGKVEPVVKFTAKADIERLEAKLRAYIYAKVPNDQNTKRQVQKAFSDFDTDGSGAVSITEFIKALERFGMHCAGQRPGVGGLPMDVVQGLFDKCARDPRPYPLRPAPHRNVPHSLHHLRTLCDSSLSVAPFCPKRVRRYDRDSSGAIDYKEFTSGLFAKDDAMAAPPSGPAPSARPTKGGGLCAETAYLRESNHIFGPLARGEGM